MRFAGHVIVRLVAISIGLFLAILAAAMFLSLGMVRDVVDPALQYHTGEGSSGVLVPILGIIASPFLAGAVLAPAAIVIAIAELMRWRSFTANLLLGGLVAVFSAWHAELFDPAESVSGGAVVVVLAAGFIAGFFYWIAAGRTAGNWLNST